MNSWLQIQENILERDLIAEIKLSNITPIRIGGYNAKPFSHALNLMEIPRVQSMKGLWRWWARAILAGAILHNKGSLPKGISNIDKMVSKLLGSTKESSKLFIQLTIEPNKISYISSSELKNIPRVKLVTMGLSDWEKRIIEQYYKTLSLKVTIGTRKNIEENSNDAVMFALSSLIISIIFSGIGSITTRGFGKLKINNVESKNPKLSTEIINLDKLLKELYQKDDEYDITKKLKDLILVSLEYASSYMSLERRVSDIKISEIPLYPTLLLNCDPEIFRLETICISKRNSQQILECLGRSVLKTEWKRKKYMPIKSSGKYLHTWVLGLPRYQELTYEEDGKRKKQLTGYIIDNEKEKRRQSPIGFTILECSNGLALVMYGFLTSEFSKKLKGYNTSILKHIGVHITNSNIKEVVRKIKSIEETNVYDDLLAQGVSFPRKSQLVDPILSTDDLYKLCFDAAWDFVRQIIKDGCCR
ncbi:MAG: type III-B CRISPR module RAMP protein Cmr1 [Candidatus Bathyarchaeia archaeon]